MAAKHFRQIRLLIDGQEKLKMFINGVFFLSQSAFSEQQTPKSSHSINEVFIDGSFVVNCRLLKIRHFQRRKKNDFYPLFVCLRSLKILTMSDV